MTLESGTHLGPYEILAPLGAGGMGEVFRARDTRLDRGVAIKVLPAAMARDAERIARFQREAKLLATLNHPNIAAIYGFEEADGKSFLVLELVEGETLAERFKRGSVPVDEALEIGRQMAEALEAAHERAVIHRDLKPANVKLAPDGRVKVLDYGLAKALASDASATDIASSPTITAEFTRQGVVLGTAAYMSPEQARGKPLDKRTDIWSFGCVLFESLSGVRPFDGETSSDIVAKILERDPDYVLLPSNTPPGVRSLIYRCLEKDRRRRLRDIGDAVLELDEAVSTRAWSTSAMAAARAVPGFEQRRTRHVVTAAGLFLLGIFLGAGAWKMLGPSLLPSNSVRSSGHVSRVSIALPKELHVSALTVSPDGATLAFLGKNQTSNDPEEPRYIFSRSLDRYEFKRIPGTERANLFRFSSDGRWIAFLANIAPNSNRIELRKVPVDGSAPPVSVCAWKDEWRQAGLEMGFAWHPSGNFLTITASPHSIVRIPADGGPSTDPLPIKKEGFVDGLSLSATFLNPRTALVGVSGYDERGYRMGVGTLDLESGQVRVLVEDGSRGAYVPTGHLVFSRFDTLLAAPFDLERLKLIGGPTAVVGDARTENSWQNADFAVSRNGTLVYAPGGRVGANRRLIVVDEQGNVEPWSDERRPFETNVAASPDGKTIAVVVTNASGLYELWVSEAGNRRLRRLAAEPRSDCWWPRWTPDGAFLIYNRNGTEEHDGIYRLPTDGSGQPELLLKKESKDVFSTPTGWAPEGDTMLLMRSTGGRAEIHLWSKGDGADGQPVVRPLLAGRKSYWGASFSPDGRWILYASDESGRIEVYMRSFDGRGATGTPISLTANGGNWPQWSSDGKRVYYFDSPGVMALDFKPGESTLVSEPRLVVDLHKVRAVDDDYTVLPDGRLMLIQKGPEEEEITHVNLVINWFEELKSRVPVARN